MKTLTAMALVCAAAACGQEVQGDWKGTLRPGPVELRILIHIKANDKGELTATMDSLDQGGRGIPVDRTAFKDGKLVLEVARIQGRYEGTLDTTKKVIHGSWTQGGTSLPLDLQPNIETKAEPRGTAAKPSDIDGDWSGTIETGGPTLRVIVHVVTDAAGKLTAAMDVPDQGAKEIPAQVVTRERNKFTFEMRGIAARYSGTLNPELTKIEGTWTQGGNDMRLVLQRTKKN